jgi:hypothetical protein
LSIFLLGMVGRGRIEDIMQDLGASHTVTH